MRAVKGRLQGNVVYLEEPSSADEGKVLIPKQQERKCRQRTV